MTITEENKSEKIKRLWTTTTMDHVQIARKANCSQKYVAIVTQSLPRPEVGPKCQRPRIEKKLEPCGNPRHRLPAGELLGVCERCWNEFRPLGSTKTVFSGQRSSRSPL